MSVSRHVIEAQQFDRPILEAIFTKAQQMEREVSTMPPWLFRGKIMVTLFYEPSTRTRLSFEAAMLRGGGQVVSTENAREFSSAAKGETLEDTIRTVEGYGDVIVLRHFEEGAAKRAAAVSAIPVINAGDGAGQHPTQALLDLYTIRKELGRLDNLHVAFVGDLKHGRTVRSLAYLLTKFDGIRLSLVSPNVVRMRSDLTEYLHERGVPYEEAEDLRTVLPNVNVVYQTRIQKERFVSAEEYHRAYGRCTITKETLASMKPDAVILHPLPRVDEITPEVDRDPRAAYFRQAHNGLFVRMALLDFVLNRTE